MITELRMREAKELLGHQHDDRAALMMDEHRKCVELDTRQLKMRTLIAGLEDSIAPQQQGEGGAAQSTTGHLTVKKLKLHDRTEAVFAAEVEAARAEPMEVAPEDAPAQVQAQLRYKPPPRRDPSWLEELGMDSVSPYEMLGEPAADSAASGEILRTATDPNVMIRMLLYHDTSQGSTTGQDKTKHGGGFMVKIKAEILDILKVKNEAESNKLEKDVVGAAATAKQEHVDSYVRGGVEDGGVERVVLDILDMTLS